MAFNDSPLPRTRRSLETRRADAESAMRRATWVAYFVAVLNVAGGYLAADEAPTISASLVPAGVGLALAACGYALSAFRIPAAAIGLIVFTVALTIARWMSMGRPGTVIPGLIAIYIFWQAFEAASEWVRLRDHVVPDEGIAPNVPRS
jgi:hypothetical protein